MKADFAYFLLALTSLFTVINPFSSMPMFLSLTSHVSKKEARIFALRANISAFSAMVIFALCGSFIFDFFGISVNGLKLVGGVLFFVMGYDLLQGKKVRTKDTIKVDNTREFYELAVTPFGIPMICGPGALTVTAVLVQDAISPKLKIMLTLSVLVACILNFVILVFSAQILKFLGPSGNKVFFRLMGLILMMIAVEYFFNGLTHYVRIMLKPVLITLS